MQSDVDFGCFLSGGLDSSINAILMSKHMGKPIKALTVYFDDDKNNEISFSRSVADILKAQRFEKQITQEDF
jgi:asparagine synthase (glutamine-hydrolysing)